MVAKLKTMFKMKLLATPLSNCGAPLKISAISQYGTGLEICPENIDWAYEVVDEDELYSGRNYRIYSLYNWKLTVLVIT